MALGNRTGVDGCGGPQRAQQTFGLRIGAVFKPEPAACIGFARLQGLPETVRLAQRIATLEQGPR